MEYVAIGASVAMLALASLLPLALAGSFSEDAYFACWKQADYVRPALDPWGGKEAWVANCVTIAFYVRGLFRHRRAYRQY